MKATRVGKAKCLEKSLLKWRELEKMPAPTSWGWQWEEVQETEIWWNIQVLLRAGPGKKFARTANQSNTQFSSNRKDLLWFFRNITFNHQALDNAIERSLHGCLSSKEGTRWHSTRKSHISDTWKMTPSIQWATQTWRSQNPCILIPLKTSWKLNTVGKGISEQARIRKQDFALGISNYPPIPPQILSLWLFRLFCILYLPLRKGN